MSNIPLLRGVTLAGVSFRTPTERTVAKALVLGEPLILECEPTNAFDKHAVKVRKDDMHLGYIPKDCSAAIALLINTEHKVLAECAGTNKAGFPSLNVFIGE